MLIRLQRKNIKFAEIKNSATTYISTGASIMELDGKYGFLCGEDLDMISFGAFVMCVLSHFVIIVALCNTCRTL